MSTAKLLHKIAQTRLRHRLFVSEDTMGYLLSGDRVAVRLDELLWTTLAAEHDAQITKASRRLKWAFLLWVPAIILTMAVIANVPILDSLVGRIHRRPIANVVFGIFAMAWLPLLGVLFHWRAISAARSQLENQLKDLPRIPAPTLGRRAVNQNLQVLVMILCGPVLLIHLCGSIFPDALRNTPLTGSGLGWLDLIAALALAGYVVTKPGRPRDR